MLYQTIKPLFTSSVNSIVSDISQYTVNPEKDLSRNKKLPANKLISFLVSEGYSSTKNELLDFFDMEVLAPTLLHLTNSVQSLNQMPWKLFLSF